MAERRRCVVASAPGKVIVSGEHAVVHGKKALAASVGLRSYVRVQETGSGKVELVMPDVSVHKQWPLAALLQSQEVLQRTESVMDPSKMTDEHAAILQRWQAANELEGTEERAVFASGIRAFLYALYRLSVPSQQPISGLCVTVNSFLPVGAGLGSSAAWSVALVSALLAFFDVWACGEDTSCTMCCAWRKQSFRHDADVSGDPLAQAVKPCLAHRDFINRWAFQLEVILHGTPSGVDNSVATYGGALTFQSGEIERVKQMPELRFLLTNTKVPRDTKTLVAGVRHRLLQLPGVVAPLLDSCNAITDALLAQFAILAQPDVAAEDAAAATAQVELLIDMNQAVLQALGVSHASLETICRVSASMHLHSKLTGAGGGGCALTLLPASLGDRLEALVADFASHSEMQGFALFQTSIGGRGVALHLSPAIAWRDE